SASGVITFCRPPVLSGTSRCHPERSEGPPCYGGRETERSLATLRDDTMPMNVILFGATGMIGQGVLGECLGSPDVQRVVSVGRHASGTSHPKLREIVLPNVGELGSLAEELAPYDACFFCVGVSAVGMSEEAYTRVTYDLTLGVAETLVRVNPAMT